MTDDQLQNIEKAQPAVALFHHMLGWSRSKFNNWRDELADIGVIFPMNLGGENWRVKWWAFPSTVKRWTGTKGQERKTI